MSCAAEALVLVTSQTLRWWRWMGQRMSDWRVSERLELVDEPLLLGLIVVPLPVSSPLLARCSSPGRGWRRGRGLPPSRPCPTFRASRIPSPATSATPTSRHIRRKRDIRLGLGGCREDVRRKSQNSWIMQQIVI
ncbi:hypothetical protein PIB30_071670 [Stylosanthes scabra]|uniref:Uncharacterized protein n=1 Tax=Stylosanthes scabra TaxID=79078 RepID=A0ABU6SPT0_9FABA|nr:hypothetical protein [Stylosanthes scabra]